MFIKEQKKCSNHSRIEPISPKVHVSIVLAMISILALIRSGKVTEPHLGEHFSVTSTTFT